MSEIEIEKSWKRIDSGRCYACGFIKGERYNDEPLVMKDNIFSRTILCKSCILKFNEILNHKAEFEPYLRNICLKCTHFDKNFNNAPEKIKQYYGLKLSKNHGYCDIMNSPVWKKSKKGICACQEYVYNKNKGFIFDIISKIFKNLLIKV